MTDVLTASTTSPAFLRLLRNGDNEHDAEIDACAEAWRLDIVAGGEWKKDVDAANVIIGDLCKRLEEAEEALAATMAYHSNNTGLNMRWHKEALARLPKNWASKKWVLLAALAGKE